MTCFVAPLTYGNLVLSAFPLEVTVGTTPVLTANESTIKYYDTQVRIRMVVSVDDSFIDGNGITSVDQLIQAMRTVLLTRGLPFSMNYRGFGTEYFIDTSLLNEITYGPHPNNLEIQPLGANRSVSVDWTLTIRTTRCPIFPEPSAIALADQFQILEFTESSALTYDEEGAVVINTEGRIELAATYGPTREQIHRFAKFFLGKNHILKFKRTVSVTYEANLRAFSYVVTDTEVKSDNPFFPYMIQQDIEHSIESNLFGQSALQGIGFVTWANTMNGEFIVRPNEWKGWAWVAFAVYMWNRRSRTRAHAGNLAAFAKDLDDKPGQENQNPRKEIKPCNIPLNLRITESLNSRKVSVSSSWVTRTSLSNLFSNTGMFFPVNTMFQNLQLGAVPLPGNEAAFPPLSHTDQWTAWQTILTGPGGPQHNLGNGTANIGLPQFSLLFDPCDPASQSTLSQDIIQRYYSRGYLSSPDYSQAGRPTPGYDNDGAELPLGYGSYSAQQNAGSSTYLLRMDPAESWIDYKTRFIITEMANSAYVSTVDEESLENRLSTDQDILQTHKNIDGIRFNGKLLVPQERYAYDVIQVRGKPIYKIRMVGYAIRVGWAIPTPVIRAVNSKPAYRIGVNQFAHEVLAVSDEAPVYQAMWDIEYGIMGTPDGNNFQIQTSAKPSEFV